MTEIHVNPTTYTVSVCPPDDLQARDRGLWDITVAWSGRPGRWAVRGSMGNVYDIDGNTEYEPLPSDRDDGFLERYRFDLDTALELAKRVAPTVTINGMTAVAAYEKYGSRADGQAEDV